MPAVRFTNVSKLYPHHSGPMLLRDRIVSKIRKPKHMFAALQNVTLEIERGEGIALVGHNGAGKSTMLSLTAGLTNATSGLVEVAGSVAPLLELGSGFHPDLTGEENIRINASLMGMSRRDLKRKYDSIVEFSGLGDFIREPLRTYSSGMVMRLGFSVAISMEPDVLVADEILGVGDRAFFDQCLKRMLEFREQGKTILFASHSPTLVTMLSDRAVWLHHGRVMIAGPTEEVLNAYGAANLPKEAAGVSAG
ncbi:MAG: ABC transporter ATP-binding protein [Bryobacteraceae bacterium]|nr:ABC transporter ATP-binding protein [Bryobacteraceae bacterium]